MLACFSKSGCVGLQGTESDRFATLQFETGMKPKPRPNLAQTPASSIFSRHRSINC